MTVPDLIVENPIRAALAWVLWSAVSWAVFFFVDAEYRERDTGATAPVWFHAATAASLSLAWPILMALSILGVMSRKSPDWLLDKVLLVLFPWWVRPDREDAER